MVTAVQNNKHNYYPYMPSGVFNPQVQLVVPQGQMPSYAYNIPPQVMQPQQQNAGASVNYEQISPYINTRSGVFMPNVQAKSGADVSSIIVPKVETDEAQIVYQGPVKTVNPQIVPMEQADNEADKRLKEYLKQKAELNSEFKKAFYKAYPDEKKSTIPTSAKVIAAVLLAVGLVKYRKKIPLLKNYFNK